MEKAGEGRQVDHLLHHQKGRTRALISLRTRPFLVCGLDRVRGEVVGS
jgi:hypothetical protein